jgi:hypothetical protein
MTIVTPPPAVDRDRYDRPLVTPTNGGKPVAYARCTSYISCIEDMYNIQEWEKRCILTGLADNPALLDEVREHAGNKGELKRIARDAKELGGGSVASKLGTHMHEITELHDRGLPVPELPANEQAMLDAYVKATADLKYTHIEQFCVQDMLQIGGTPDRIFKIQGKGPAYIGDLKTGSIELGITKIAMQLAVYARSHTYDVATGERGDHEADRFKGLIVHLPYVEDPADAVCTLVWVDIDQAWNDVILARNIRETRKKKFRDITEPYVSDDDLLTQLAASVPLAKQIEACTTADEVRALWALNASEWTDTLTEAARIHINSLPAHV